MVEMGERDRRLRLIEFRRLLRISGELSDGERDELTANCAWLDSELSAIRGSIIPSDKVDGAGFERELRQLQCRLMRSDDDSANGGPQRRALQEVGSPHGSATSIDQERRHQEEVADEMMVLTESLKGRAVQIAQATNRDEVVMATASDHVGRMAAISEAITREFGGVRARNIGLRVYLWVLYGVIVFVLVQWLFM